VQQEVLRLKALMPGAGCRRIAHTFNRLSQDRRDVTVGKTFVAGVLRHRGEEVLRLRREIKHRQPRSLPRNLVWALDWTWIPGPDEETRAVLGVVDHGSRACLELQPVESRRTVTLLRQLLDLFQRFGTPKILRTDNEPAACSLLFRVVLRVLGIRHQRSEPFAPWQNGRIERLFRTVKEVIRLRDAKLGSNAVSAGDLVRIRTWYNHLRPHQHLDGRTPAEIWDGKEPDRRQPARWVSDWDGILAGCYWPE
jgi:transposase InsO family protein